MWGTKYFGAEYFVNLRFIANKMADYNVNKVVHSRSFIFSEKKLPPNWEVNQPELTFGLPLRFIRKVITFSLYFLRYSLTKHISGISKEKVDH